MNYSFDDGGSNSHNAQIRRHSNIFLAVVIVLNVGVLTWTFWPTKPATYEDCLVQMAEKAKGNATIYNSLAHANCRRMSPAYIEDQAKKLLGD